MTTLDAGTERAAEGPVGFVRVTEAGGVCSCCGRVGLPGERLGAGLGVLVCPGCIDLLHAAVHAPTPAADGPPPWAGLTADDVLAMLPRLQASSRQLEQFLFTWVAVARHVGLSWQDIGTRMGVSRQAVWERFAKRLPSVDVDRAH